MIKCIKMYKEATILKALRNRASCIAMHHLNVWEIKTDEKRKGKEGGKRRVWRRAGGEGVGEKRSRGSGTW